MNKSDDIIRYSEEVTSGFTIWTVLVSLITLVYIVLLVQLFRHRNKHPFKHTFFQISLQLGIANVLMIVYSFFWYRLPSFHVFPANFIDEMSDDAKVIFSGSHSVFIVYFLHVQIIGTILLSVNRYTSLCWPLRHKMVCLKFEARLYYVKISLLDMVITATTTCIRMSMVHSIVDIRMVVSITTNCIDNEI
jgi:hypothetical protein